MNATIDEVQTAISHLEDAHQRVCGNHTTDAIINALSTAAHRWLAPDSPWRAQAVQEAPAVTGFSPEMIHEMIDVTFGAITPESLGELVDRELGNRRVLDEFCLHGRMRAKASGPRLLTHILAGNIPAPGLVSICGGLLLRAGNLVKVSRRDPVFPALFVESLREIDPELAECVAVLEWSREDTGVTQAALRKANGVIAYGDDSTIASLRAATLPGARFLGYGHKLSLAVVGKEVLTEENLPALAEAAAFDVSIYDQQGCLSPHLFFIEERGQVSPRRFGLALAEAMAAYQARVPRGPLAVEDAARVNALRLGYEFRAQTDRRVTVWTGETPTDWAVIYEDEPTFDPSCLNRIVFVKPTDGFKRVLNAIQRFAALVSCVGVSPLDERAVQFAGDLARLGIHRVCPIGQMQRPPLSWHHDGRPNLADLVHWTDIG